MKENQSKIGTDTTIKVQDIRQLTPTAYILRFDRNGLSFEAGQHVLLGLHGSADLREYSIYSGEQDPYLEVLVKEVDPGDVSRKLKKCQPGEPVKFDGPMGFFTLDREKLADRKFLFIASGTGIAPFHSFVRTFPHLNYNLLHGIRYASEAYEKEHYDKDRIITCTTRDDQGVFQGRVTDYLRKNPVNKDTLCYLCGNVEMIHDAYDILTEQGLPADHLHSEVYF